jgi:hypothetical protein
LQSVLAGDHPLTLALLRSIRAGRVDELAALLAEHPELAAERFGDEAESRSALHLATDWPGRNPRVAESIALLVAAGATVDARFVGHHRETALHWAASADDIEAIDALLDAGADIEADGGVLTDGTPLADAVVFAQWTAARRLVERGASMTIWQAAALGDVATVRILLATDAPPVEAITNAAWHACRAGQLATARLLTDHGADLDWLGYDDLTARAAGLASGDPQLAAWLATV